MSDSHALVGAYAVDAVDDLERARFDEHLTGCSACRAEIDGLRAAASMLASATSVTPPAALRDLVLAEISTVRPLPPVAAPSHARRRRWAPFLAAAAAVLIAGGVGATWQPWNDNETTSVQLTAADRIIAAPDAEKVSLAIDTAKATVVRSRSEGRAVVVTQDMPAPPTGKVYELWLRNEKGVLFPAGLMPPGTDHTVVLEGDATKATGVGITIEPAGGSKVPTQPALAMFEFSETSA